MIRVFLVDDEFYERLSLKSAVPWEDLGMAVCGEANNGLTAYNQMLELKPDIAIVDINMPRMNGLDLISGLREKTLACRFIILTAMTISSLHSRRSASTCPSMFSNRSITRI